MFGYSYFENISRILAFMKFYELLQCTRSNSYKYHKQHYFLIILKRLFWKHNFQLSILLPKMPHEKLLFSTLLSEKLWGDYVNNLRVVSWIHTIIINITVTNITHSIMVRIFLIFVWYWRAVVTSITYVITAI